MSTASTRGCASEERALPPAKKINGRKRHIAVDTLGLLLCALVTAAPVQYRDGGGLPARTDHDLVSPDSAGLADGGYAGKLVDWARTDLQIVKRYDTAVGFAVLPRRWVVERTQFGLDHPARRCVRDYNDYLPITKP